VAITAKVREEVLWSGPCAYCGDRNPTQVDHIIPRSRGGTDDRENLAPACRMCNMEKLDFTPDEYREYRESEGLGWPPQSIRDFIRETYCRLKKEYGYEPPS
jgi:5-methylcytosine-specific restriction endonuclease McrA